MAKYKCDTCGKVIGEIDKEGILTTWEFTTNLVVGDIYIKDGRTHISPGKVCTKAFTNFHCGGCYDPKRISKLKGEADNGRIQ